MSIRQTIIACFVVALASCETIDADILEPTKVIEETDFTEQVEEEYQSARLDKQHWSSNMTGTDLIIGTQGMMRFTGYGSWLCSSRDGHTDNTDYDVSALIWAMGRSTSKLLPMLSRIDSAKMPLRRVTSWRYWP